MRRPNTQDPQTLVHPDLSPPFPDHRSTSPIANHSPTSSDLDNRPQAVLHQALQHTGRHHRSLIWPPPTTSPLHSTPKPTRSDHRRLHPLWFSLSRSLFPSISRSFFPLSLSLWINDVFVLIFVSCVVYIFWFCEIIFIWILRKCEKQYKNGLSRAFSAKQPNTRKYFPKYFLECNQTLVNIFLSQK